MEIVNPAYNRWNSVEWKPRQEFMRAANLGDIAVYSKYGTVQEGRITLINWSGVNISTNWGDRFVKWHHVLKITKS